MKEYLVEGHEPSLLPENGKYKLVWSDEFDGKELDMEKWSFRRHLFHREHEGWVGEEGVYLDGNSCLVFKLLEKDGKFYSSQLQTGENWYDRPSSNKNWNVASFSKPKFMHKYGYYEARVKLQKGSNWWSSFWLQSPSIGTMPDEKKAGVEVDIMEAFYGNAYIPHFLHWGGYGEDHKDMSTLVPHHPARKEDNIPVDEGFHRFGCLWDEEGYTFFVDGKQSGRKLTEAVSHTEQFILVGTECVGYRGADPSIYEDRVYVKDDCYTVDYVRVFDLVEE